MGVEAVDVTSSEVRDEKVLPTLEIKKEYSFTTLNWLIANLVDKLVNVSSNLV